MFLFIIYLVHATNYAHFQKPLIDAIVAYQANPTMNNYLLLREVTKNILKVLNQPAEVLLLLLLFDNW